MHKALRVFLVIGISSFVYVLLANAKTEIYNPMAEDIFLNISLVVPIVVGVVFGKRQGGLTGIVGSFILSFTPVSRWPHVLIVMAATAIGGWLAGLLAEKYNISIAALSIFGVEVVYLLLLEISKIPGPVTIFFAVLFEGIIGIIVINLVATLLEQIITVGERW